MWRRSARHVAAAAPERGRVARQRRFVSAGDKAGVALLLEALDERRRLYAGVDQDLAASLNSVGIAAMPQVQMLLLNER